jgi:hypothetical protein
MKLTAAVLALLAVTLSAAPAMASVADSASSNAGASARHHRHHHHRRHHHVTDGVKGYDVSQALV